MEQKITFDAWLTLVILSSIALITMYGETMLIPAIPDLVRDFDISYNTSSWILTAYLITGAVMTPIAGRLSDIYGRKKILLIIMIIYTVGTLIGGLSTDMAIMISARIIQGIGMSIFPVAFGIIRDKFPQSKLAIGQGIFTAIFAAGSVVGLAAGATIIEYFGWRMTFFTVLPFSIILFAIIKRYLGNVTENLLENGKNGVDIKGAIILVVIVSFFLISVTLFTDYSEESITNTALAFTLLAVSILMLPVFLRVQKNAKAPLIDLSILKNRILLPTNLLIMTIGISIFMIYQSLPIFIQSPGPAGFGGGPIESANVQLPFMIISFMISVLAGFIITKIGNIKLTIIGSILSTTGFLLLFFNHDSELVVAADLSIIAVGISFAEVGAFNIALVSSPFRLSGTSLGVTVLLFVIGMSIGPAIAGMYLEVFQTTIDDSNRLYPSSFSYDMIFLTAVVISVLSIILSLIIKIRLVPFPKTLS